MSLTLLANAPRSASRSHAKPGSREFSALLTELGSEFAGRAGHYDRTGEFPHDNFRRLHEHGLLALTIPTAKGGLGGTLTDAIEVIGAIAKGDPSTALILVMQYLQHGRLHDNPQWPEHLRQRLVREAIEEGALINALRVEPELGSPSRGGLPATVARRTAEGWRISGSKLYSTGSHGLTWYNVFARSDDADPLVGVWLIQKDSPGIRIVEDWDHLGMRGTCSHRIDFDEVLVPLDHAVNVAPASRKSTETELDATGQLWMSAMLGAVYDGVARAARDWLVDWLQSRTPSNLDAPLASLPRFQQTVGEIDSLLLVNRTLLDSAGALRLPVGASGQLKYLVTSNAIRAVELALEVSGNPGLSKRNELERHYRNVLCSRIHTPQNDVVLIKAGRAALNL
jgi:alkylation response protein AidB-like acyl-CoA dehydrogenase